MRQTGQSTTEFLVAAVALVPLLLLVPMVGKYQAIAFQTEAASRYAAFDAVQRHGRDARWSTADELQHEVAWRFFARKEEGVSTQASQTVPTPQQQNPLWHAPNGEALFGNLGNSLSVRFGPAGSATDNPASGQVDAADGGHLVQYGTELGLRKTGIHVAQVTAKADNLPSRRFLKPLDQIDFSVTRQTALVVDGWTARDPDDVNTRLSTPELVPAVAVRPTTKVIDGLVAGIDGAAGVPLQKTGPVVRGPRLGDLEMWTDVVPEDRLKSRQ